MRTDVYYGSLAIKAPRNEEGGSLIRQHMPRRVRSMEIHPEEIAAKRVRAYMWDMGRVDRDLVWGWKQYVADRLNIPYATALKIINGNLTRLGLTLVKHFVVQTGCPISVFYDEKVRTMAAPGESDYQSAAA